MPETEPVPGPEPAFVPAAASTFREKIVMAQGIVMIILVTALVFLVFRLSSAESTNACDVSRAATAAALQQTRQAYGNEGRAAAAALADSVIAVADSPAGVQKALIVTAEKTYAGVMTGVDTGLAANPVLPVMPC
jgi:hypothetical protein